jgi:hypothetical protein
MACFDAKARSSQQMEHGIGLIGSGLEQNGASWP